MNSIRKIPILLCILMSGIMFSSCSSYVDDPQIYTDVPATFIWGGSPATDGPGLILIMDADSNEAYGIPGVKKDYSKLFGEDNQVNVIADFKLTGEETIRGWGITFEEADIIDIRRR